MGNGVGDGPGIGHGGIGGCGCVGTVITLGKEGGDFKENFQCQLEPPASGVKNAA